MAYNDESIGDRTFLEEMLLTIFGGEPGDQDREKVQRSGVTVKGDNSKEFDLQNILSFGDNEVSGRLDDIFKTNSTEDASSVEFLYRRPNLFYEKAKTTVDGDHLNDGNSVLFPDGSVPYPQNDREQFVQAHNGEYRQLMEEFMLIKCCSKEILDYLEEAKTLLTRHIELKNEPGIDTIYTIQGWTWILKEALVISYTVTKKDRRRRKYLEMFLAKIFNGLEESFKNLTSDIGNVVKAYQKVEKELGTLKKKSTEIFANNVESARYYEKNSSGYEFFIYRSNDESITSLKRNDKISTPENEDNKGDPLKTLQVRCSVDGITLRSGKPGSSWHKLQSVDQDKDKQVFLQLFTNELYHTNLKASSSLKLVNDLLAIHKAPKKNLKESILQSISHCKKILDKPRKRLNFLPKEEVILLYSMSSMAAAYELIKPLLAEVVISFDRMARMMGELCQQRKYLKGNVKVGRVPLGRHSRFELKIVETNVNIDLILNRYPNLYDAKQLREKIFQKLLNGEDITDDFLFEEPKIEMLYKCPSDIFSSPSTQEMISLIRKLIIEEATTTNPNPAHLLFADFEAEYIETASALVETREITPEALKLCSDPIQKFNKATEELTTFKDRILIHLVSAVENLLFIETYPENRNDGSTIPVPTFFWVQLLSKAVHVWDFHSIPKHLQRHFHSVYVASEKGMHTLTQTFSELAKLVAEFQEAFLNYYRSIETAHKFSTWIKKKFQFNLPETIISKWKQDQHEQAKIESASSTVSNDKKKSEFPSLQIEFTSFDMQVIQIDPKEENMRDILISLNTCNSNVQVGLISIFFTYFNQISNRVVINLNSTLSTFRKNMSLKELKNILSPKAKRTLTSLNRLEDIVLALMFERLHKNMKEMNTYLELVEKTIAQFHKMFQMIHLHMEDRAIIPSSKNPPENQAFRLGKKLSKKEMKTEMEHLNHDAYLNETTQLLRTSVKAMPSKFEIIEGSVKHSLLHWVHLSKKDARLKEIVNRKERRTDLTKLPTCMRTIEGQSSLWDNGNTESTVSLSSDQNCPVDFEEIMIRTTTGKAFFPDPLQFNSNIECWRNICFKMLSAALDKFREITTTKIIEAKEVLCHPRTSKLNAVNLKTPDLSHHNLFSGNPKENNFSSKDISPHSTCNMSGGPNIPLTEEENTVTTPSPYRIGFAEGLCSILCLITKQLTPKDRSFATTDDLKLLKNKFLSVTTVIEKFQKDLDSMENVLINGVSSSMASVEYKVLPHHLPFVPNEDDYLRRHDLQEVASSKESLEEYSKSVENDRNQFFDFTSNGSKTQLLPNNNVDKITVEIHWDSANKDKIFCRNTADDEAWLEFGQLHVKGQLKVMHILIDELAREIEQGREFIKGAKLDLICAKKLLEKTWKGIRKDMKRGRIPDSGILVLAKLYRFQIAGAVSDSKTIKKIAREVDFLLRQSSQWTTIWNNNEKISHQSVHNSIVDTNYIMSLENLSLTIALMISVPTHCWMMKDVIKTEEEEADVEKLLNNLDKGKTGSKCILDIKMAVEVKSSTSLDQANKE